MLKNIKTFISIFFVLVLVSSCQRVASTISSYSNLVYNPSDLIKETFVIIPDDNQKTSVEFEKYASSIASIKTICLSVYCITLKRN